jgi:glycerol-3-phosphate cytidylyltransferase
MIISPHDLQHLSLDRCVGLTSGCFDLLHFYHLHYLERCRAECDFLIVGVDSDELLFSFKNKTPCIPEHHRAAMVAALRCVDAVFIMRNLDQFQAMAGHARKIFKNHPELYGKPIIGGEEKLFVIPDIEEVQSTSAIVAKIRSATHTPPVSDLNMSDLTRIEAAKRLGWTHVHYDKSSRMCIGIAPTSEAASGCKQVGWEPPYHELPFFTASSRKPRSTPKKARS